MSGHAIQSQKWCQAKAKFSDYDRGIIHYIPYYPASFAAAEAKGLLDYNEIYLWLYTTKPCNWLSRFVGINGTKFLRLWVFGNIFCPRFKTSYKCGLNDHGCVLECPPPSPCDSRPSNFCALFRFYCVRRCQQGIGKIGIIFLYLRNNSNPNHLKVENWLLFWLSAFSRGQIVFLTSFWLHANCYAWRIT